MKARKKSSHQSQLIKEIIKVLIEWNNERYEEVMTSITVNQRK